MTGASPLQFFQQMVTLEMLEQIVEQTNLYAQQYMESTNLPPHSRAHGWSRATFDTAELKKFLATTITMGLISYPELEDYWSTCWPYATSAFSKVSVSLSRLSFTVQPSKRAKLLIFLVFTKMCTDHSEYARNVLIFCCCSFKPCIFVQLVTLNSRYRE